MGPSHVHPGRVSSTFPSSQNTASRPDCGPRPLLGACGLLLSLCLCPPLHGPQQVLPVTLTLTPTAAWLCPSASARACSVSSSGSAQRTPPRSPRHRPQPCRLPLLLPLIPCSLLPHSSAAGMALGLAMHFLSGFPSRCRFHQGRDIFCLSSSLLIPSSWHQGGWCS